MNILVIDDSSEDVSLLSHALSEWNPAIQLTVAHSGERGMAMLLHATKQPTLIILDLDLLSSHGWEVLSQIRTHWSQDQLPVMLTSKSYSFETLKLCEAKNVFGFLPKTLDFFRYRKYVFRLMQRFQLNQASLKEAA